MRQATVSSAVEERCRVRLANDVAALEAFVRARGGGRLRLEVERFGRRIRAIELGFTGVRTPFRDRRCGEVVVREAAVVAEVRFDASPFPYPLGPPEVRLRYPGRAAPLVPWTGGIHWDEGGPLPEVVRRFFAWMEGVSGGVARDGPGGPSAPLPLGPTAPSPFAGTDPCGIPCLFRSWSLSRDLVWLARQIHRLLSVDPRTMASPGDAMNPAAATYWATQVAHALPLEPGLPEAAVAEAAPAPALRLRPVKGSAVSPPPSE